MKLTHINSPTFTTSLFAALLTMFALYLQVHQSSWPKISSDVAIGNRTLESFDNFVIVSAQAADGAVIPHGKTVYELKGYIGDAIITTGYEIVPIDSVSANLILTGGSAPISTEIKAGETLAKIGRVAGFSNDFGTWRLLIAS